MRIPVRRVRLDSYLGNVIKAGAFIPVSGLPKDLTGNDVNPSLHMGFRAWVGRFTGESTKHEVGGVEDSFFPG